MFGELGHMNWFKDNWFKIGVLIILGFVVYIFYLRYHPIIPEKTVQQITYTNTTATSTEPSQGLQDCLNDALKNYSDTIDMYTNQQSGITYLPARTQADTELKNDQDICLKEYK